MTDGKKRPQTVFESIEAMTSALAKRGISKEHGGTREISYNFRGIDDIRNNTAPIMYDCAIAIVPNVIERIEKERITKSGTFALWVTIRVDFGIYNTIKGDHITVSIYADAVDYSDKATSKAVSQAYKTLAINLFNIPTEGEQDTDAENITMQLVNHSVFANADLRNQYAENCKAAFLNADTQKSLTDAYDLYRDKISAMYESKDAGDKSAGNELREVYAAKFRELKAKIEKKGAL